MNILSENHEKLIAKSESILKSLFETDKYLNDIPFDVTYSEILDIVGIKTGIKIQVEVYRGDENVPFQIAVDKETGTVSDIKQAIKREYEIQEKRKLKKDKALPLSSSSLTVDDKNNANVVKKQKIATKKISWRYIWRTYVLDFNGVRLTEDNASLKDYGITNNSILKFSKKYKSRK